LQPIVLADDLAVGQYAAEIIFTELVRAKSEGHPFVLGCPGGRTPRSTYNALAAMIKDSKQDISHVVIAMMDEYLAENADGTYSNHTFDKHFSCTRFAKLEIFDVLNAGAPVGGKIPEENVRFPDASDPQGYEDFLRKVGVDVFIMASGGSDGHVAFNPPGTPGIATYKGGGKGVLTLQLPLSFTYQKSASSVTEEIEARTPVLSKTLSNRKLPATRTPAQCMPNSLLVVGNPLKTPGIVG
jgi:6-phosphogluconolactonase/glucosamine-6-phosphate isomerase/deaminase